MQLLIMFDELPGSAKMWLIWFSIFALPITFAVYKLVLSRTPENSIPFFGKSEYGYTSVARRIAYITGAMKVYRSAYGIFKDSIFRMTTFDGDRIIIPACMLDEVAARPDSEISAGHAQGIVCSVFSTTLTSHGQLCTHVYRTSTRQGLTPGRIVTRT